MQFGASCLRSEDTPRRPFPRHWVTLQTNAGWATGEPVNLRVSILPKRTTGLAVQQQIICVPFLNRQGLNSETPSEISYSLHLSLIFDIFQVARKSIQGICNP
jgi:hypothetical protein